MTFSDYLGILSRRRWTVAGVAFGFLALMGAYAFLTKPVYRATALVDVERVSDVTAPPTNPAVDDDYLATQAKLIVSETALRKVYRDLALDQTEEFKTRQRFRDAVEVLAVPKTRLCYINAESVDRALAVKIADALAQNFIQENLNNQLFMSKHVLASLDKRARGADAQKVYESLPAVLASPLIQGYKQRILQVEGDLASLRTKETDDHPEVVALRTQLGLLRSARDQEIDRIVGSFRAELSGQLRPNNVRLIDPPYWPERPVRPRKMLALLLGIFGGLVLGCLAAIGLESLDQTIRTQRDVERGVGLPVLGHIPRLRLKKREKIYAQLLSPEPSLTSEAFRTLRAMLASADKPGRDAFLLVTSAAQDEGKSFVAANLAVALSQLGKKTLIIDGDLRRASQDRILGEGGQRGLSDFLSGKVASPGELLQGTGVPALDLIGAGEIPPNPAELLSVEALPKLLKWAHERYDRVIVDCPPVFPISDTLLWGIRVRTSLMVSRSGYTPLDLLRTACERLRAGGVEIVGAVINGARPRSLGYADGRDFKRYIRRGR